MRSAFFAAVVFLLAIDTAQAEQKVRCESKPGLGSTLDVACALPASAAARRYRLKATFSGSHDDTRLSMEPTLDGGPLACDPGSKLESEYEDGEVTLECRFSAASAGRLKATINWHHAQFGAFDLVAD